MDTNSKVVLLEEKSSVAKDVLFSKVASAVSPPPKPMTTLSSRVFQQQSSNVDSGIIKQGDWRASPERSSRPVSKAVTSLKRVIKKTASTPVTPPPEAFTKPLRDANLTDEKRAQLRADRAAAAEARITKQQLGTKKANVAPLVSPHSSKRMRWSLG